MSKANTFELDTLKLILTAVTLSTLAEDKVSGPATDLYIGLHTGDPGEAGDQTTSECAYTSYARVAISRAPGSWTIGGDGAAENTAAITFPQCTGGSESATHFSVGVAGSGAGYLLYKGALGSSLAISNLITPQFAAGDLDITED